MNIKHTNKIKINDLRVLINKLTEFGINPKVECEDKILEIKRLLVEIYAHYLNSNSSQLQDDDKDSNQIEAPRFDYNETRKIVESNFPDLGWYSTTLEINET